MIGIGMDKFGTMGSGKSKLGASGKLGAGQGQKVNFASSVKRERQRLSKVKKVDSAKSRRASTLPSSGRYSQMSGTPSPAMLANRRQQLTCSETVSYTIRRIVHHEILMMINFAIKILAVILYMIRATVDKSYLFVDDEQQCQKEKEVRLSLGRAWYDVDTDAVLDGPGSGTFLDWSQKIFPVLQFHPIPKENKTLPISENWNGNNDFNIDSLVFICSPTIIYNWQVGFATFNLIYAIMSLLFKLDYKDHNTTLIEMAQTRKLEIFFELWTTVPFVLSWWGIASKQLYIPVFLNIWLARDDLCVMMGGSDNLTSHKMTILFDISSNILTSVLFLNHLERAGMSPESFDILNSIWFVGSTFSTVGYGDIYPTTWVSKIFVTVMMFKLYSNMTGLIGQLISLTTMVASTGGEFHLAKDIKNRRKFVILCITEFNEDIIADFLNEFYQPKHNKNHSVVILCCTLKNEVIKGKLTELEFENKVTNRVHYYLGSCVRPTDLERIQAREAEACFIMTPRTSENLEGEDQRTVLRAMHFHTFAPHVNIYVHVLKIKTKVHVDFANSIICDEELSHAMFSLNCRIPGCSTAMVLLCHTTQGESDDDMLEWQRQINNSVDFQIHAAKCVDSKIFRDYIGHDFARASYLCHKTYGVSLIAINRNENIIISPKLPIEDADIIYYISGIEEDKLLKSSEAIDMNSGRLSSCGRQSACLPINETIEEQVSDIQQTFDTYDIDPLEQLQLQTGMGMTSIDKIVDRSILTNNKESERASIASKNCGFTTDFPPFCPVIDRSSLHVICFLNSETTLDMDKIIAKTTLKREVFGTGKRLRSPIIVILPDPEGLTTSIFNLIIQLRAVDATPKQFNKPVFHPIILVSPKTPDTKIIRGLERFPEVYFHVGEPTSIDDLMFCNVLNAFVIIYMNGPGFNDAGAACATGLEALQDRTCLTDILHLERMFPKIRLISCLMSTENLSFLEHNAQTLLGRELDPAFNKSHRLSAVTWNQVGPKLAESVENVRALGSVTFDQNANDGTSCEQDVFATKEERDDSQYEGTNKIHPHMSYLYKESFASGKTFTLSMFDTLLYQSYNKNYLPELLKLMLGLTYANESGRLGIYRIFTKEDLDMTYGQLYRRMTMGKRKSMTDSEELIGADKMSARAKPAIPIGLYRYRYNLRHNLNYLTSKMNISCPTLNAPGEYNHILGRESQKSERQLIDEYLEKRSREMFGDSTSHLDRFSNSKLDSKTGYVILNPVHDLKLQKGDIVYILKACDTPATIARRESSQSMSQTQAATN